MQQRCSPKQQAASSRATKVKLRKSPIQQFQIHVKPLRQTIQSPAQNIEHARHLVFRNTSGLEKQFDAHTQFRRTPVRAYDVIERSARILTFWGGAVRVCSVV